MRFSSSALFLIKISILRLGSLSVSDSALQVTRQKNPLSWVISSIDVISNHLTLIRAAI
jgi:hypothetical protein